MTQQADFDGSDRHVVENALCLGKDIFRRQRHQAMDIVAILFGQCGYNAAGMAMVADQGLYIGLYSGSTAGVVT